MMKRSGEGSDMIQLKSTKRKGKHYGLAGVLFFLLLGSGVASMHYLYRINNELKVVIDHALLNQLFENIAAQLLPVFSGELGELRVGLQLFAVGILELPDTDVDAVDPGRIALADEAVVEADEDEGETD